MAQKIGNALAFFVFDHWFDFNLELWYYPLGSKEIAFGGFRQMHGCLHHKMMTATWQSDLKEEAEALSEQ